MHENIGNYLVFSLGCRAPLWEDRFGSCFIVYRNSDENKIVFFDYNRKIQHQQPERFYLVVGAGCNCSSLCIQAALAAAAVSVLFPPYFIFLLPYT